MQSRRSRPKMMHDLEMFSDEELVERLFESPADLKAQSPLWLRSIGGLSGLLKAEPLWLCQYLKVTRSSAMRLRIASILVRRAMLEGLMGQPIFARPKVLKTYLCQLARAEMREMLWVLFLDQNHRLICQEKILEGERDRIIVCPRKILKLALMHEASAMILAHNHPAENAQPSSEDGIATEKLFDLAAELGIQLIDHFVVTRNQVTSLLAKGWIRYP